MLLFPLTHVYNYSSVNNITTLFYKYFAFILHLAKVYWSDGMRARKWLNASQYMFAWSVIESLIILTSSVPFALTMYTFHLLSAVH